MVCQRHVEAGVLITHASFLDEYVFQPTGAGRLLAQSTKPEGEEQPSARRRRALKRSMSVKKREGQASAKRMKGASA